MIKNDLLKGKTIAFIGAGNMAEALIKGLLDSGTMQPEQFRISDVVQERIVHFARQYNIKNAGNPLQVTDGADIVLLAVKPQHIETVLRFLKGEIPDRSIVVSIAAGVQTSTIEQLLGGEPRVVRVMPNTPALIGYGASGICPGQYANEQDLSVVHHIMATVGVVRHVGESRMDAVTAVSGSGPAYVFYLIEAMIQGARECGLDEDSARVLIPATVEGAARMCMEPDADPTALRQRVTSKGGTTAAALALLDANEVSQIFIDAIHKANARSIELSEE